MRVVSLIVIALASLGACKKKQEPQPRTAPKVSGSAATDPAPSITRLDFNRFAVRLDLPIYWIADANDNKQLEPSEVASLLFYPTQGNWVANGAFTPEYHKAYADIVAASVAPAPKMEPGGPAPTGGIDASPAEGKRRTLVRQDLDAGRPSLVRNEVTAPQDKAFVQRMLEVATLIDTLFETTNGAAAMAPRLPADPESRSLFRRNRGIECEGPISGKDPACSAVPGAPKNVFDIYPAAVQESPTFCKDLAARKDGAALMGHFNVVRGSGDALQTVPYTVAYKEQMTAISNALLAAADVMKKDPNEKPLVTYLTAAAASFLSNDWIPADEAWSKMNVDNSRWYVRVGPDEVYWEPCAEKAGFHLSFARINQSSRAWQQKLVPVQQEMENLIAAKAGPPYKPRKVTFHLPDFIDIVVNAGQSREALSTTIGQSLPNWGPVANEGRGRTVAMLNINADPDSRAARQTQAESVLDADAIKIYPKDTEPGLLSTILHEATHNLGPAHEYKVKGKAASDLFTGPIASMLEELKAQTGGWFLVEMLRSKGLITDELARNTYGDIIVWSCGHISQGMYTGDKNRKAYGNVAAIHIGYLVDKGALAWDANKLAANGTDKGAFTVHVDKIPAAMDEMMKEVGGIKARGDRAAAEQLIARYVDSDAVVPHKAITERFLRQGKPSYVYSVSF